MFVLRRQASEECVHFIVSRQICLPAPDILQEAPWGMDGPPPYSPVDLEQTLLVSNARARAYTTVSMFRGALLRRFLSGANDPRRYCSPIKDEPVIFSSPRPPPPPPSASHFPCLAENTSVRESQIIVIILSFAHGWNEEKLRSVDGGETRKQQSG